MSYSNLLLLTASECVVTLAAFAVLLVDLSLLRHLPVRTRMRTCAWLTALGCLAGGITVTAVTAPAGQDSLNGMFFVDPVTVVVKLALLLLTLLTAFISTESEFTEHVGEYFALLLLATVGMMFLVSASNLLMIFVSLELLSLSLYIMAAFNKRNLHSAEAALKYFLVGGVSAAFLLFGLSLLYGVSGSLYLPVIAKQVTAGPLDPLALVALVMVVIGMGFKVAAVPFHAWAPDAYEGAPVPSAAFIASGSKVASFFILAKIMMVGFADAGGVAQWGRFTQGWVPLLAVVAALSMLVGNLAAIAQSNVRRLLAYSAIAQAGYMLLGVLADNQRGLESVIYYTITYGMTTLGAFGVVAVIQENAGHARLPAFAGLSRRSPLLAFSMLVFMLSLAGIPPLAGFFGKFYVFTAAAGSKPPLALLWLVILAVAMSAVSLYYYLQVLKQIYVAETSADTPALRPGGLAQFAIAGLALGVVLLGCMPELLLQHLHVAAAATLR